MILYITEPILFDKTIKENIVYGVEFDDIGVENTAFDANDAKVSWEEDNFIIIIFSFSE